MRSHLPLSYPPRVFLQVFRNHINKNEQWRKRVEQKPNLKVATLFFSNQNKSIDN